MKRFWIIIGSVLTVGMIGLSTAQAIGVVAHEELDETYSFPAADLATLRVHSSNGFIEVTGDPDATEISVAAHITNGLQRTHHHEEVEGDTLDLRSSCPVFSNWCSVDYRITVPARLRVDASGGNGHITVRDVTGQVQVGSNNGRVELVRLTGNIVATTDNGRISATGLRSEVVVAGTDNGRMALSFATPPTSVGATADNGHIEIVVPDTPDTYAVTARSDNGSTDTGIRTDPASTRTITATTDNGDVTIHYPAG